LVLLGDAGCVGKAQDAIKEVIKNEGAVDSVTITDQACKELGGKKIQELQTKHSTYIQVIRKDSQVKIFGSVAGVEATKKAVVAFAKKADSIETKLMTLEPDQIGRVIGSKGATLNSIRKESGAQISINNDSPVVEIRGDTKAIATAEKLIEAVLVPKETEVGEDRAAAAPKAQQAVAATAPKAKAKAKAKEYKADLAGDFPTLGGGGASKKIASKAWNKNAEEEATPAAETKPKAEAYPTLAAKEKAPVVNGPGMVKPKPVVVAAPVVEEEEEDGGDCDDPFAMMGGMGEEEVYQITHMAETDELPAETGDGFVPEEEEEDDEEEKRAATLAAKAAMFAEEEEDEEA